MGKRYSGRGRSSASGRSGRVYSKSYSGKTRRGGNGVNTVKLVIEHVQGTSMPSIGNGQSGSIGTVAANTKLAKF